MRILMTGAAGYIGKNLAQTLVEGGVSVDAIVRQEPPSEKRVLGVKYHLIAGWDDHGSLLKAIDKVKPDVTVHLAALLKSSSGLEKSSGLVTDNIGFTTMLAECLEESLGSFNMIHTGTSTQNPTNGDYDPINLYAATKEACETILKYYAKNMSTNILTLRLTHVYGPGDYRENLMSQIIRSLTMQQPLDTTAGEQMLEYVHIDDAVTAYLLAINHLAKGNISGMVQYDIGGGEVVSIRELHDLFSQISGRDFSLNWGAKAYPKHLCMRPSKRTNLLPGWTPKMSLQEGIRTILKAEKII